MNILYGGQGCFVSEKIGEKVSDFLGFGGVESIFINPIIQSSTIPNIVILNTMFGPIQYNLK